MQEEDQTQPTLTYEKRLIGTKITGKPARFSIVVSLGMMLLMALTTQIYWQDWWGLAEYLPAVNKSIFSEFQWWRAFTATFIHADFGHYLSNMYMLGVFSFFIFGYFGVRAFPLWTVAGATLVNVLSVMTYPEDTRLLGASGLVYVLGGWWLCMYFLIQRQYSVLNRTFRVTGTALMVFFPTTFVPTTSYRTHAIGFAVGVIMAFLYYWMYKKEIRSSETFKTVVFENHSNSLEYSP